MKALPILLVALLTGCAERPIRVAATNEAGVIVKWDTLRLDVTVSQLHPTAEAECAKYGRHARYVDQPTVSEWAFDCVK